MFTSIYFSTLTDIEYFTEDSQQNTIVRLKMKELDHFEKEKLISKKQEFEEIISKSQESTKPDLPKHREYLLVVVLLFSQFVAQCTDTFLFPFFPYKAKNKGLNEIDIGIVFSSFELARFVTAPVLGYLVRLLCYAISCYYSISNLRISLLGHL